MKKITWDDTNTYFPKIACLGFFDGLHLGHQKILLSVLAQKFGGLKTLFFTFDQSFNDYIKNQYTQIMDNEVKKNIIKKMGFDYYLEIKLNSNFLQLSAFEFLELLRSKFKITKIVVGSDFKFGKNRQGDIETLKEFFGEKNVLIVNRSNEFLASRNIRKLLIDHKISEANKLLIEEYSVIGTVKKGTQIGRKINFPTANIYLKHKLIIPYGAYVTKVKIDNDEYQAMSCYFLKGKIEVFETYILNYHKNIYRKKIQIFLLDYLRANVTINSLEQLKKLLEIDLVNILAYWKKIG